MNEQEIFQHNLQSIGLSAHEAARQARELFDQPSIMDWDHPANRGLLREGSTQRQVPAEDEAAVNARVNETIRRVTGRPGRIGQPASVRDSEPNASSMTLREQAQKQAADSLRESGRRLGLSDKALEDFVNG